MDDIEGNEWITPANDCTYINFDRNGADVFAEPFLPAFTYPIFGDDEHIIGFKKPSINLRFRSHDLQPHVAITHKGKMAPPTDEIAAKMDLDAQLKEFIPEGAWDGQKMPVDPDAGSWKPPGDKIQSYSSDGKRFEIWCANLTDTRAKTILANMRIFISLYIEGGTCNFLDDPEWSLERWKIFLIYEVSKAVNARTSPYCLAGFGTSYRNWVAGSPEVVAAFSSPPPSGSDLSKVSTLSDSSEEVLEQMSTTYEALSAPSRERISQFLILPPYQRSSHGTQLYSTMTRMFLRDSSVFEITVEDPNEAFDDLRDYCDLARLILDEPLSALRLPTEIDAALLASDAVIPLSQLIDRITTENIRRRHKLAKRQFNRLLEMQLLTTIEERHRNMNRITQRAKASNVQDRQYYFWRLFAKARLFWQNKDTLAQLDADERVPKLEETLIGLQEDYDRILQGFDRKLRAGHLTTDDEGKEDEGEHLSVRKKRKVIDDDEDEDEDGAEDGSRTPLKKVKA